VASATIFTSNNYLKIIREIIKHNIHSFRYSFVRKKKDKDKKGTEKKSKYSKDIQESRIKKGR